MVSEALTDGPKVLQTGGTGELTRRPRLVHSSPQQLQPLNQPPRALWVIQPTPGSVERPARLCPLVCQPPFLPWALVSTTAPAGLTFCPGSRCTRRAACRAAAGRSAPSRASSGGSGPRAWGPSYLFSPGLQEKGSVPTSSSPPSSPQRVPTPPAEQETEQAPTGSQQGPGPQLLIIAREVGRVGPFLRRGDRGSEWRRDLPKTVARRWQGQDGTLSRPSLWKVCGGRPRRNRCPHRTSLHNSSPAVTNHSRAAAGARTTPSPALHQLN